MDSRDRRGGVEALVRVLRKITRLVQITPFAYLLLLAVYLICESILPEWAYSISDNVIDLPVHSVIGMLILGRILRLCSWFKTACILPFTTKVECYIDSFIYTFTQGEIVLMNAIIGILFLTYIYLSFRHFFYGRKENSLRNP